MVQLGDSFEQYQLSAELIGHSKDVRCVAEILSSSCPSGEGLVSCSRDNTAKVWLRSKASGTFELSSTLVGHSGFVAAVASMPECQQYPFGAIFTASHDKTIKVYSGIPPTLSATLEGHTAPVCSLAVDLQRQLLVSGSWDATARVWSGADSTCVLASHEAAVWGVAVVPDDEPDRIASRLPRVLTASADKRIFLWSGDKVEQSFTGHTDCVRALSVISSSQFLSASNDATIRRWHVSNGDCTQIFHGHEAYIYSISFHAGRFASGGEDGTCRLWRLDGPTEPAQTIRLPATSVWSVAMISNGDVATATSDGVVRVFSTVPARIADAEMQALFADHVTAVVSPPTTTKDEIGGIKIDDMPGMEALQSAGKRDGQMMMVRTPRRTVECYSWSDATQKWDRIGDVVDAKPPSEGKSMYMGKEYDFVFVVDVEEGKPALKLPYNRGDDPWRAAQTFIDEHQLPQTYLDTVAQFIVKNAPADVYYSETVPAGSYVDPFTGGGRYVPGSTAPTLGADSDAVSDPFSGGARYVPAAGVAASTAATHPLKPKSDFVPIRNYTLFATISADKVKAKLRENNASVGAAGKALTEEEVGALERLLDRAAMANDAGYGEALLALEKALDSWPTELLLPVLDILRFALLDDKVNRYFFARRGSSPVEFISRLRDLLSPTTPTNVQVVVCRAFANAFAFKHGEEAMLLACAGGGDLRIIEPLVRAAFTPVVLAQTAAVGALVNLARLFFCADVGGVPSRKALVEGIVGTIAEQTTDGLDERNMVPVMQVILNALYGERELVAVAKREKGGVLAKALVRIKDAVGDETGKDLARTIERMLSAA